MLRYLNQGERFYGTRDVHAPDHCRRNWEVLAVAKGSVRPLVLGRPYPAFREDCLWLMPPESQHCWESPRDRPCEVFIFHFASIHPLLENSLPPDRISSIRLGPEAQAEIASIYQGVERHYLDPRPTSGIAFEVAMLRICELLLRHDPNVAEVPGFDPDSERVLHALQWHREHMAEGANVTDVAKALHLSPVHLRRLFLRVRKESPNEAFTRLKLEEACRLMSATHLSMKEVAARCGFRGFSEFYRFFRKHMGQSPSNWKGNQFYGDYGANRRKTSRAPIEAAGPQDHRVK